MPFLPGRGLRGHRDIDRHAEIAAGGADKAAGDGDSLTDVAGDGDADQVATAYGPVRWIIGNPAGARQVDIGPCVGRPGADDAGGVVVRGGIVEIPRHDACSEAEAAGRFDQQDREVAARAPAAVERLYGG